MFVEKIGPASLRNITSHFGKKVLSLSGYNKKIYFNNNMHSKHVSKVIHFVISLLFNKTKSMFKYGGKHGGYKVLMEH